MINKIYKRIHNKYSVLFKFIFFLRYLFGIFFISIVLFLLIPHFFDFKKKERIFKNYLIESYGLKLNNYDNIKYNSLPIPNLEIQNANIDIDKDSLKMDVASLRIYPKLLNIYNYEDFETNRIALNNNKITLEDTDLKNLFDNIFNLKNKLTLKNLDLEINRKDELLINLKKINFSNYGYDRDIVKGKLFDKKFKISIRDNNKKINFKLIKTGISADINFDEIKKNYIKSGIVKSKILNSNLKFNFVYNDESIKIYNFYFRNKDLFFNGESVVIFNPFFDLNSSFNIEDISMNLLKKINITQILASKNLLKKINTKNEIKFKSKRYTKNLINNLNLNINLAYGRLVYSKKILISDNLFICQGDASLLEEYPILYFDCSITSNDKKKLLNEFTIKYKKKNEVFKVNVEGNINILNNKINLKNITMNENYKASKEDLKYFKQSFENIIFDEDFLNIFNFDKIKKFILEIS